MGCDIHGVIEVRDGEHWIGIRTLHPHTSYMKNANGSRFSAPLASSRNYERFAALAGVRGEGPAARGLPDDASDTSRWMFENEGEHTPSWLTLKEAAPIFLATEHYEMTDFDQKYPCYAYFGIENDIADRCRLVFWFDS